MEGKKWNGRGLLSSVYQLGKLRLEELRQLIQEAGHCRHKPTSQGLDYWVGTLVEQSDFAQVTSFSSL